MAITYTKVTTEDESYSLSALLYPRGYSMASLCFGFNEEECWDNTEYLYHVVYPYLKGELKDESHLDEMEDTFSNVKEEVLEIFEEADRLGFFNELKTGE